MFRIAPQNLAWALDNLVNDVVVNEIVVEPETKRYALTALQRMIDFTEAKK
jgi:quinolinate synthase